MNRQSTPTPQLDRAGAELAWALLAAQAREAGLLFERYSSLAGVAMAAVDRGDGDLMVAALDERDRIAGRLEPLMAALNRANRDGRPGGVSGGAPGVFAPNAPEQVRTLLQPVEDASRHAAGLHAQLEEKIRARTMRLATELDALERHGAARVVEGPATAAYSAFAAAGSANVSGEMPAAGGTQPAAASGLDAAVAALSGRKLNLVR